MTVLDDRKNYQKGSPVRSKMSKALFVTMIVVVLAFVYFVPAIPDRIVVCPPGGNCPTYYSQDEWEVSATYYALGVGGRFGEGHYQIYYLPGWTCHAYPSQVTATITSTNGTLTTTRVVSSTTGIECTENVITVS